MTMFACGNADRESQSKTTDSLSAITLSSANSLAQSSDLVKEPTVVASVATATATLSITGVLHKANADDFVENKSSTVWFLDADDGKSFSVSFDPALEPKNGGVRISATATVESDGALRIRQISSLQAVSAPVSETMALSGQKSVLVILLRQIQEDDFFPYIEPKVVYGQIFTDSKSVAAYYQEATFGTLSVSGTVIPSAGRWYAADLGTGTCNYSRWREIGDAFASASGVNVLSYDHVIYVVDKPNPWCNWAGMAYVPGRLVWINGWREPQTTNVKILAHELGHNLGRWHAKALNCSDSSGNRVSFKGVYSWNYYPYVGDYYHNCGAVEYGDLFDVMGVDWRQTVTARHFNAKYKDYFGLLSASNKYAVTRPSRVVVTLAPIERSNSGYQMIAIPIKGLGAIAPTLTWKGFVLEARTAYGFDNFGPTDPVVHGVNIRFYDTGESFLIDTTPETPSFEDATLLVGRTFTIPDQGITLRVRYQTAAGDIAVEVCADTDCSIYPKPKPPQPPLLVAN